MHVLSEGVTVHVFLARGLLCMCSSEGVTVHLLGEGVTVCVFLARGLLCVYSW